MARQPWSAVYLQERNLEGKIPGPPSIGGSA